jgi:peptidyl-prolyl cis-trans isomerase C
MKLVSHLARYAVALSLGVPLLAFSAEPVLAEAAGKHKVDANDVRADALRIPPEIRKSTLNRPESVQQLANNLAVRRAIAADAEAAGLASDSTFQSAIRIAREKVLSDAMLAKLDAANKPSRQVLEGIASLEYKANPRRFDLPEETGTSHILIKKDTPAARATIEQVLGELKRGGDFAALARKHSEDASASQGGLLGYFPDGKLVPEYEAAAKKLKAKGELSGIVETQFGFHIIRLEGRRPPGLRPFEQVKDVLIREAEAKILNDKRTEYVQRIQNQVVFDKAAIEAFSSAAQ